MSEHVLHVGGQAFRRVWDNACGIMVSLVLTKLAYEELATLLRHVGDSDVIATTVVTVVPAAGLVLSCFLLLPAAVSTSRELSPPATINGSRHHGQVAHPWERANIVPQIRAQGAFGWRRADAAAPHRRLDPSPDCIVQHGMPFLFLPLLLLLLLLLLVVF